MHVVQKRAAFRNTGDVTVVRDRACRGGSVRGWCQTACDGGVVQLCVDGEGGGKHGRVRHRKDFVLGDLLRGGDGMQCLQHARGCTCGR